MPLQISRLHEIKGCQLLHSDFFSNPFSSHTNTPDGESIAYQCIKRAMLEAFDIQVERLSFQCVKVESGMIRC